MNMPIEIINKIVMMNRPYYHYTHEIKMLMKLGFEKPIDAVGSIKSNDKYRNFNENNFNKPYRVILQLRRLINHYNWNHAIGESLDDHLNYLKDYDKHILYEFDAKNYYEDP